MLQFAYLEGAPFSWVTVALRFGLQDSTKPVFGAINIAYGDLPLSIELDISSLQGQSLDSYRLAYLRATAIALVKAGIKYNRPSEALHQIESLANLRKQRGFDGA